MDGSSSPKASNPRHSASLFSKLTCSWFNPFLAKGYSGSLSEHDFYPLNPEDRADCAASQLEANWNHVYGHLVIDQKEEGFKSDLNRIFRVWKVLIRSFGWTYAAGACLELLQKILSFAYPILLKMFLEFMGNSDAPLSTGYLIASLFFLQSTVATILKQLEPKIIDSATRRTTSGFKALLYRKALAMDTSTRSETTSGDVINLLTSDAPELSSLVSQVNQFWLTPIEIGLALL